MSQPCTWCGTEHNAEEDGFCSENCRRDFHIVCRIYGEEQYGCGELSIFRLKGCLGRRARRVQRDLASEGVKAPETGMRADAALHPCKEVAENAAQV